MTKDRNKLQESLRADLESVLKGERTADEVAAHHSLSLDVVVSLCDELRTDLVEKGVWSAPPVVSDVQRRTLQASAPPHQSALRRRPRWASEAEPDDPELISRAPTFRAMPSFETVEEDADSQRPTIKTPTPAQLLEDSRELERKRELERSGDIHRSDTVPAPPITDKAKEKTQPQVPQPHRAVTPALTRKRESAITPPAPSRAETLPSQAAVARDPNAHRVPTRPSLPSHRRAAAFGKPARVLLVDDDDLVCRSLSRYFGSQGYHVTAARNGHEAIQLLVAGDFDVVLSDIWMPGITGVELLRELRSHDPDVPIVLITARPDPLAREQAAQYGAYAFFEKPVPVGQLEREIFDAIIQFRNKKNKNS